ncbi:hypothetical protein SDC9_107714 [bioreactor metagenome]|uniref:Uncharacterized protein n=1 Tax=bioreactor metagenome TaxID=1076179 RepID=A0A645B5Z5_9ZZZZ
MKLNFFLAVSAVILLGFNSVGQTAVDVNSCPWVKVNTVVDANGLPLTI